LGYPGIDPDRKKPFQIVRQSQPYGTFRGPAGLFFIAYAASPKNFNYMLDRMTGQACDRECDNIMRLSENVTGQMWYFPPPEQLRKMLK
jgi:deferrochelatase/peroxidase EfeB